MSEKSRSENPDPFGPFIQMSDLLMKSWADVLSQTVTSPTFAHSMGEQMQGFMEGTKLIRQQMQTATIDNTIDVTPKVSSLPPWRSLPRRSVRRHGTVARADSRQCRWTAGNLNNPERS